MIVQSRSSSSVPHLPLFRNCYKTFVLLLFGKVQKPLRLLQIGPNMWCFWDFDFETCFALQRRAPVQTHFPKAVRTFLTWKYASPHSGRSVFNMLISKYTSRHGGISILTPLNLQKQLTKRSRWGVLHILASKQASRQSPVHFFNV